MPKKIELYDTTLRDGAQGRQIKFSSEDQLRVVRIAAVVTGCLGIGLAIWAGSIVKTMQVFYALLSAGLFVPVMAGLFLPRTRRPDALAAMIAGLTTTAILHSWRGSTGLAGIDPVIWGIAASATALAVSMRLRAPAG